MSAKIEKEIEALNDEASAFMRSQVLLVANQYGLFTELDGRSMTSDEIALSLGTDPRATRMILDALAGMNYLEKENGAYRNSEISRRLLVAGSPHYQGDSLRHRYRQWFSWSALRDVMKTGVPPESLTAEYKESDEQRSRDFTLAMSNSSRIRAERLVASLDVTGVKVLLDLGGGPGTYALALARRYPAVKAVVFDLPEVCPIAREQIEQAGLSDRVSTLSGDFLADDLGEGYDLIFVSNIIHSYSLSDVRKILRKSFDALNPDGRIVVKDFFVGEDRSGPLFSLLFAVNMLVNTRAGDTYTFCEIEQKLSEVGFTPVGREKLTEQSWMIIGKKERGLS